jgi:hypothetical protein
MSKAGQSGEYALVIELGTGAPTAGDRAEWQARLLLADGKMFLPQWVAWRTAGSELSPQQLSNSC